MWIVDARSEDGLGEYVYEVDAPPSEDAERVAVQAYSLHGHYYRQGLVGRLLGPNYSVEWTG